MFKWLNILILNIILFLYVVEGYYNFTNYILIIKKKLFAFLVFFFVCFNFVLFYFLCFRAAKIVVFKKLVDCKGFKIYKILSTKTKMNFCPFLF